MKQGDPLKMKHLESYAIIAGSKRHELLGYLLCRIFLFQQQWINPFHQLVFTP